MEITLEAGAEPVPGYRLVEPLGRGGCGEVWKAIGPGGFELALKFVCLAESIGPLELRALQIIKDVRHPHLLATFGSWQVGRYLIIAMELAERTLLDRFRETAGQGFPGIPAPEIHEHFLDAARGLDYLNEPRHPSGGAEPVGIQHRDVKPQNLLLVGGSVKVADFGLARILEHTQTSHTGSMTPAYAAPEFFKKQTSSQSDQYSLAVTYCHLRGGRLPFTGGMAEIMAGHLLEPPDLTMLPEGEREATARALAKEPRDRWGSCRALVDALRSGVPDQDRVAPTTGPAGPPAWGTFRPGEAGEASSSAEGPEGSAPPVRPASVSPLVDWHARPEVHARRSATAMSDRGRKVLALSLSLTALSVVLVLGLWALGVLAPFGRPRGTPGPTPVAAGPGPPIAPERAPTLSIDVPASLSLGLGDKKTLTLKVRREGFEGPIAVRFKGLPEGVAIEPTTIPSGATETEVEVTAGLQASTGDREVTVIGSNSAVQAEAAIKMTVVDTAEGRVTQTPSLRSGEMAGASPVLARKAKQAKGTLVVRFRAVGAREAPEHQVPPSQPRVTFVVPGCGGDRLGLKAGDLLLQVDGWEVATVAEAETAIKNREPGSRIELTVERAGQRLTMSGPYETVLSHSQIISRVRRLAERGDVEAQVALATFLATGEFTGKDDSEAVAWYRKAADQGNADAQNNLGVMYRDGSGVAKDEAQAVYWYRKAAEQGNADAQDNLGVMYANGRGVAKDDAQAIAWYRKAADQGDAFVQNWLGLMYENGRGGVAKDDAQAVHWYRKAAEQGEANAQFYLGLRYANGRGVAKDEAQAVAWYRKAADQGSAVAQDNLGDMYRNGRGVAKDDAQAVAWYRKAADKGNASAQNWLGVMYDNGRGVAKDEAQAVAWYRKAADKGNAYAQRNLGLTYEHGRGVAKDDAQAVAWYRKAADQGLASAQNNLGVMYDNGRGVAKDDAQAVAWYRKAADQGEAYAQCNLGAMYANGRGVAKDDAQAVAWYRKAADQGSADAQLKLGWMYANGRGVAKDEAQAVAWYRKAADQGQGNAQRNLGLTYEHGRGVAKDDAQAVAWYRKAADQGLASAQNNLGWMYENGRGVAKDDAQAVAWYRKAADQGDTVAAQALRRLNVAP